MCGIVGTIGIAGSDVDGMIAGLAHRGPDHTGTWADGQVALGHARLSIIDISHASDQPMEDPSNGNVIVYNGEIYNFRELRADLEARGARFDSAGDTEVILKGYALDGVAFFSRLNGIFAFALHDRALATTILLRDPVGIKPLYVTEVEGGLAFASEAKVLYALQPTLKLDPVALGGFFRFHFNPTTNDLMQGIRKLLPGVAYSINDAGQTVAEQRLDFDALAPVSRPGPRELWSLLDEAVERQMVADVPVGTFLSGGIDSTIITALAARHMDDALHTFTVGFDAITDERPRARSTAESLGAICHEVEVDGESVYRDLGVISWHLDAPVAEQGAIPNYYVSREAKRHVTVVLAGEGADELFGGYPQDTYFPRMERMARLVPRAPWLSKLPGLRNDSWRRKGIMALVGPSKVERYGLYYEWMTPEEVVAGGLEAPPLLDRWPGDHLMAGAESQMRWCYLEKADRMTMAHGLEERVPFLDLKIVAASRAIPMADKLGPPEKKILREAAAGGIPDQVVTRKKLGYGVPTDHWMETSWKSRAADEIEAAYPVEQGWMSRSAWDALASVAARPGRFARAGLQLLCLSRWLQEIDRRVRSA